MAALTPLMQPTKVIDKYYLGHDKAKRILLAHSEKVAKLAVNIAKYCQHKQAVDIGFIEQAALLHDIGMLYTDCPGFGCHGEHDYIAHGVLGAEMMRQEGLPQHALVCERHIGVGLSIPDIKSQGLPLPLKDMRPQTLEEEIITYADLFFSKKSSGMRTAEMIRSSLAKHGQHKLRVFDGWHARFSDRGGSSHPSV